MLPRTWSEGQIVVRAVEVAQTPALHAAILECVDVVGLDPTFAEVPESTVGELVEQSVAEEAQERGFRMRSIHVGPTEELAGYFHLMEDVPNVGDAWLSILAIRQRFRRSVVGTTLIGSLKRVLSAEGFRFALARIYLANVPGLAILGSTGFHRNRPPSGRLCRPRSREALYRSAGIARRVADPARTRLCVAPAVQTIPHVNRPNSRGGMSSSTPPKGANRARMACARLVGDAASVSAARKIARASSSIERPCSAAWTRRRCFMSSSRLRIVMLAMFFTSNSRKSCSPLGRCRSGRRK